MIVSRVHVQTTNASKYLLQLSKHWSHRFPDLTYDKNRSDVPLPGGPCVLEASATGLDVTLSTETEADATRLEQVVAEHVKRFAFREELTFDWAREGAPAA